MTGHSNGAMMTYRMAAEHPSLFDGVAPVSDSIGGKTTPTSTPYIIPTPNDSVNIVAIHGSQDTNVLYNGGITKTGFNVDQSYNDSVNQSMMFWINNDNCSTIPTIQNSTNNVISLETFTGGIQNTSLKLVTINNANHFWENTDKIVVKENFNGSSMAEMIWNLLNS